MPAEILQIINLIAAFNGIVVGGVLLAQERFGATSTRLKLAGFILGISVLLGVFTLMRTWL